MIEGIVNENEEPVISISLIIKGKLLNSSAVIDTGFNGYLSVPQKLADKSDWYFLGYEEYEIATGEKVTQSVYLGKIIFDGKEKETYILTSKSNDILIGTKLLRDKVLTVDFREKKVKII